MGKLVVGTFVTVDGVMQAPGGPDEDREGGFEHGGWVVPFFDEALGEHMDELMVKRGDALLLGRKTYEIFIQHWPHVGDEDPMAAKLNAAPKYVASRTLERADWNNTTVLGGKLADEITRLKEHDEIQVPGSAGLIQSLLREDLVDEFSMLVFPVVLGTGKRLFGDGTIPRSMRLTATKTFPTGVAFHRYEKVGAPEYGAIGLETQQA
jgi:dihydrofolate reductase